MKNLKSIFPFFMHNPKTIYFDSGATTLKPQVVIDAEKEYLEKIAANPHSTDYDQALQANEVLAQTRMQTQAFLNAKRAEEIIFTSGTTFGLNLIAHGVQEFLNPGDEIWLTSIEHSSNLLPWIVLAKEKQLVIKQVPLTKDFAIDVEKLAELITEKSKVLAFGSVSNTVGLFNDVPTIVKAVKAKNPQLIVVVDATQEVGHKPIDVQASGVDFLAFSAHKMYGPFGVGVVYGKYELLEKIKPFTNGGGNNDLIDWQTLSYELAPIPARFEAGTPNISGIYAFQKTLTFLTELGMDKIHEYEVGLKKYLVSEFLKLNLDQKISVYNLNNDGPLFGFNIEGLNPQDVSAFLANDYTIATRSGAHCARTTETEIGFKTSVRVSLGIYNSQADIDELIKAFQNLDQVFDHLFK